MFKRRKTLPFAGLRLVLKGPHTTLLQKEQDLHPDCFLAYCIYSKSTMGISGLLQFIRDASEPVSVRKYKGQTVAVDTYCWLHKGAFSCAEKLAKGEPTDQYVAYCMKFVDMLLTFGVKPVLVFDGRNLPSKEEVEKARQERRQANLQKGKQLLREGKLSAARDCFTRCVNITPAMAHDVIPLTQLGQAARARGVDCLVAPYEADAQLAFLNKAGIAQAVITEDSDLLAFGCKKVILKMDKLGNGLEIDQKNLGRCRSLGDVFTEEKFRYMCILSGCDYLASLYGIGLGKACKLLKIANNPDILKVIRKMGQYLKMNVAVPEEYLEGFVRANNTFLYQLVFDPLSRKVVPLNPYPDHIDPTTLSYAGHNFGDKKGFQMALGNMDIYTMEIIDDFNPDTAQLPKPRSQSWNDSSEKGSPLSTSIWNRGYTPGVALPSQQNMPSSPNKSCSRVKEKSGGGPFKRLLLSNVQVKRPRQAETSMSEEGVLQQYSSLSSKKLRVVESQPQPRAHPTAQPKRRNCFATLLQKRNQDDSPDNEQQTHSRFFWSSSSAQHEVLEKEPSNGECSGDPVAPAERHHTEEVEVLSLADVPVPQPAHRSAGVFQWSGTCTEKPGTLSLKVGLSQLQQFQHKKENVARDSQGQRSPPPKSGPHVKEQDESPSSSPSSQDSAYFSQPSQPHSRAENSLTEAFFCLSQGLNSSDTEERKSTTVGAKVSGLRRVQSVPSAMGAKIRPSAPARASGLQKKPSTKTQGPSNENQPSLQATISGLWKNFSFRKDKPRVTRCNAAEPMSPVKDNIPAFASETEKDVYFNSENTTIPKNICF
ncbi:exonuclease 1 [Arapaima gigas]